MNIAYLLTPKQDLKTLFDDNTYRKGLEVLRESTYATIPVTTRDNIYVGVVSVQDFLWAFVKDVDEEGKITTNDTSKLRVRDFMKMGTHPAVSITSTVEELLERILEQNFVPVVDGSEALVGIVTRHRVMEHLKKEGLQE